VSRAVVVLICEQGVPVRDGSDVFPLNEWLQVLLVAFHSQTSNVGFEKKDVYNVFRSKY
jgi:hypothetical protein